MDKIDTIDKVPAKSADSVAESAKDILQQEAGDQLNNFSKIAKCESTCPSLPELTIEERTPPAGDAPPAINKPTPEQEKGPRTDTNPVPTEISKATPSGADSTPELPKGPSFAPVPTM